MSKAQRIFLVAIVLVLVGGLGAAMLWIGADHAQVRPTEIEPPVTPVIVPEPEKALDPVHLAVEPTQEYTSLDTTVVFALEVDLELMRAKNTPKADDAPALGTGATARLKGSISDMQGAGVRAQIEFIAGSNVGRTLYCDRNGNFGANDLYPGISVVRVAGSTIPGSMREVRLRQDRDTLLNIPYGRPAHLLGQVYDTESKLVAGAKVTMDGQVATTNDDGVFEFTNMTAGEVLCIVEKEGFAPYRELVSIAVGTKVDVGRFKFLLQRGARLQVSIAERVNGGKQAQLFLFPEVVEAQRKFPWQKVNPIAVWPGGTATIEDLPGGPVMLRLFHSGGIAKPPRSSVVLSPGETTTVTLHLEAAPVITGVVTDNGKPVASAVVRMEVPDRTQAMLALFGETSFLYLEGDVFPSLPPALQEIKSDARGEFMLASNEQISRVRYVTALSPDGKRTATAILKGGETSVELALQPIREGTSTLVIEMPGRIQPLPVKINVNGEPRDEQILSQKKELGIEKLPEGAWLVTVRWQGEVLLNRAPVDLGEEASIAVTLPEGAILGQDAETVLRAGKVPRAPRNGEK